MVVFNIHNVIVVETTGIFEELIVVERTYLYIYIFACVVYAYIK